ncbi:MAG: hypothetical protein ACR5K7_04675 [Symbiopectobacterium sp.]
MNNYMPPELVVERAQGCEMFITNKVVLTREILQALPALKLIAVTANWCEQD